MSSTRNDLPAAAASGSHPRERWRVGDLIDFEAELQAGAPLSAAPDAANRDHAIFVEQIQPRLGPCATHRPSVFLAWLEARRAASVSASTGDVFERGVQAVRLLAVLVGLVAGAGLVAALLSRDGSQPVNALFFLVATVGVQWAVLAVVLVAALARAAGMHWSSLTAWTQALVALAGGALARLQGGRRNSLRMLLAQAQGSGGRLHRVVGLQLLQLTQAFAIAFNLGILGAMLLVYLPFTELRFGWQSTYSIGPEALHSAVQALAAPWHWVGEGLAPTREQILATEFARGQSALGLDRVAARAWWPFLLCAVAFYGLAWRCAAVLVLHALLRYRLAHPPVDHPAAHALWRRLQGTLVKSEGGQAELPKAVAPPRPPPHQPTRTVALLSNAGGLNEDAARQAVQRSLGWAVTKTAVATIDDDRLAAALIEALQGPVDAVVVVAAATQNPIVAVADFLRAVRAAMPPNAELVVLLAATPNDAQSSSPDMLARQQIWQRFVAINRLDVGVEPCR